MNKPNASCTLPGRPSKSLASTDSNSSPPLKRSRKTSALYRGSSKRLTEGPRLSVAARGFSHGTREATQDFCPKDPRPHGKGICQDSDHGVNS